MKLNQGLEVQEEGEARASGEGKFLEFWASHERRRDFREVWNVIGETRCGVYLWEFPGAWGELEAWIGVGGWYPRGSECMEVRSRESRQSLRLGGEERNRSPAGGRETGVPSREERQVSSSRGEPVCRPGVRCLGAAADSESS